MSGSAVTFAGLTKARSRLQVIVNGLRAAAGGEVVARAAEKVQAQISAVARPKVEAHKASGEAASSLTVTTSGGLIQLSSEGYLKFHSWWPFRRGAMPPFIVKNASKIFAAELLAAIGADAGALAAASEVVADAAASDAKKAASKDAKKAESKRRREERAYDKQVKAREDKEGR